MMSELTERQIKEYEDLKKSKPCLTCKDFKGCIKMKRDNPHFCTDFEDFLQACKGMGEKHRSERATLKRQHEENNNKRWGRK